MRECTENMEFSDCLFFVISRLSRISNKIADEAFSKIGICPTHGCLLLLLDEKNEGLTVNEIAENLTIAPSTVTRFVDKLIDKNYVKRIKNGKNSYTSITSEGKAFLPEVLVAWKNICGDFDKMIPNSEYLLSFTKNMKEFVKLLEINFDIVKNINE